MSKNNYNPVPNLITQRLNSIRELATLLFFLNLEERVPPYGRLAFSIRIGANNDYK